MEGPSLYLAAERLQPFVGEVVLHVQGNTKVGKERLQNQKVLKIFSWAKQLLIQFGDFALRVHFLLYGNYEADIGGKTVSGDYKRTQTPRLVLSFANGELRMFACSVKYIEGKDASELYDFTADIMSPIWDEQSALSKIKDCGSEMVCDVLMNQEIFGGVGNIIKNETLFNMRLHPEEVVPNLSGKQVRAVTAEARRFSLKFYEWRKTFELKKHYCVYRQSVCPVCHGKITRKRTGKGQRISFFCPKDQKLIDNLRA